MEKTDFLPAHHGGSWTSSAEECEKIFHFAASFTAFIINNNLCLDGKCHGLPAGLDLKLAEYLNFQNKSDTEVLKNIRSLCEDMGVTTSGEKKKKKRVEGEKMTNDKNNK
jgi:hypothetical protein